MALFKKSKQPATEIQVKAAAVAEAERALEAARGVAAEASRLETSRVASAEKAAAEARTALAAAEETERRRPAEERIEERRTSVSSLDGEIKAGISSLAEAFTERELIGIEITSLAWELGRREALPRFDAGPHVARLGPGEARLEIKWTATTSYNRIKV